MDLVLAYEQEIKVFLNTYTLKDQVDFCVPGYRTVAFNFSNSISMQFPESYTMSAGNLQIKDINIDGFPDLMVVLSSVSGWAVRIFLSQEGESFAENNRYKLPLEGFE